MHQRKIGPISENGHSVQYEPARKLERIQREIDRTPHEVSDVIMCVQFFWYF